MPRDVVLSVRVTEAEARFLTWRAALAGTTVSEQLRAALAHIPPYVIVPAGAVTA